MICYWINGSTIVHNSVRQPLQDDIFTNDLITFILEVLRFPQTPLSCRSRRNRKTWGGGKGGNENSHGTLSHCRRSVENDRLTSTVSTMAKPFPAVAGHEHKLLHVDPLVARSSNFLAGTWKVGFLDHLAAVFCGNIHRFADRYVARALRNQIVPTLALGTFLGSFVVFGLGEATWHQMPSDHECQQQANRRQLRHRRTSAVVSRLPLLVVVLLMMVDDLIDSERNEAFQLPSEFSLRRQTNAPEAWSCQLHMQWKMKSGVWSNHENVVHGVVMIFCKA